MARIRVFYEYENKANKFKKQSEIPFSVKIINGFFLSRNKITVDQNFDDNIVKIHNFNEIDVEYEITPID